MNWKLFFGLLFMMGGAVFGVILLQGQVFEWSIGYIVMVALIVFVAAVGGIADRHFPKKRHKR